MTVSLLYTCGLFSVLTCIWYLFPGEWVSKQKRIYNNGDWKNNQGSRSWNRPRVLTKLLWYSVQRRVETFFFSDRQVQWYTNKISKITTPKFFYIIRINRYLLPGSLLTYSWNYVGKFRFVMTTFIFLGSEK